MERLETRMRDLFSSSKLPLLAVASLLLAGCADQHPVTGPTDAAPESGVVEALRCRADVAARSVTCQPPAHQQGSARPSLIVGGQNQFITLVSSNVHYDALNQIFSADVQVWNFGIGQQLGTPDGTNLTGVKVFFHTGPTVTVGSGVVTVRNPDGTGSFTGPNQPYHLYPVILPPNFITPVKNWQWNVPTTVNNFVFSVFVETDVPGASGFVRMTPANAFLAPTNTILLTGATFDVLGRAKAGTVTYSSSNPAVATVNPTTGLVTAVAGGRAVITASTGGAEAPGTAVVTVNAPGYQIELRYLTAITPAQQAAFEAARARWQAIVTADLIGVQFDSQLLPTCGGGPVNEFVDDLVINVVLGPIDGVGNILGQAGPCAFRSTNSLPAYGVMIFDTADLTALQANGQLQDVILHEMGHVLGIGVLWSPLGKLLETGGGAPDCDTPALTDPFFNGALAITAFNAAGGTGYSGNKVPVEKTGGPGTRCGHWRESVLNTELMTGFISAPGTANPLSAISIQSLGDLGYSVNVAQADAYTLPCAPCSIVAQDAAPKTSLGNDIWQGAVYRIGPDGHLIQLLPDRRPEALKRLDAHPVP